MIWQGSMEYYITNLYDISCTHESKWYVNIKLYNLFTKERKKYIYIYIYIYLVLSKSWGNL